MSAETEQFTQLWSEKTAAKERAFEAWQTALWLDLPAEEQARQIAACGEKQIPEWLQDKTAAECWDLLDVYGMKGTEGEKYREAEQLAIDTVAGSPALFAKFQGQSQDVVVQLLDGSRELAKLLRKPEAEQTTVERLTLATIKAAMGNLSADQADEMAVLGTMYELATWNRTQVTATLRTTVQLSQMGGKA